ncbi:expressed unknown protein [Seminavis robusta]|uniref:Uncharacterized protein n=1 Tax=Seminavis robusta TaxID=568900 RepID=A0A9N8DI77_9STRA|nr:expressed unknown protein [Seminavis robusta]|eukprot:Sro98_g050290.1 n/a (340) ;mRNA; f:15864-17074
MAASGQEVTPEMCFQGFGGLQFRFDAYDRYNEFFRNDSSLISITAGIYTGPENIEEYVRFGGTTNPMVGLADGYHQPGLRGIVNGTCEILLFTNSWYEFLPGAARGGKMNATLMSLIEYDAIENYMKNFILYLPPAWMDGIFAQYAGTDRTRDFVCRTMRDSCPDVWEANEEVFSQATVAMEGRAADQDLIPCKSLLRDMPHVEGANLYVDGDSQGCRALHSVYASTNSDHCPHMSFVPIKDVNGKIKCQESAGLSTSDYFTQEDLDKFDAFVQESSFRVDYPSGARLFDMEEMTEEEILGFYGDVALGEIETEIEVDASSAKIGMSGFALAVLVSFLL